MPVSVGVDIGGTKVLAAVVDHTGRVLDTEATETPGRGAGIERASVGEVEDALVDVVNRLLAVHGRCPVGVAAAGFVDKDAQRVRFAPHLPWRDEPLSARLTERFGHRILGDVLVDNDATAALWAEAHYGAAREAYDAIMITLGTGIGGGLMVRGRLHRGSNGMAGEYGHMQVVPDGRACQCGRRGCWEQYCSGRALARAAADGGLELTGTELTDRGPGGRRRRAGGVRAGGALARGRGRQPRGGHRPAPDRHRRRCLGGQRPPAGRGTRVDGREPGGRGVPRPARAGGRRARAARGCGRDRRPGAYGGPDQARR